MPFDPFSDRTARDIRNHLSTALVRDLTDGGDDVAAVAGEWLNRPLGEAYRRYVEGKAHRYREVMAEVRTNGITEVRLQAVALWNAGLYFELHELLETIWHEAAEPERTALKGWIQAAGAYLHWERGKADAARGLARRARRHLAAGAVALSFIVNLDQLIQALDRPVPRALRLQVDATRRCAGGDE